MSANLTASAAVSGRGILKAVIDMFNWTSYSSLHKWLIVSLAILAISWQFSLWTLMTAFLAASFSGVKLSEEILHNKRASNVAELLFYKLESGYIEVRALIRHLNAALAGQQHADRDSNFPVHLITELSSVCDTDSERASDVGIPVKLSSTLKMELNSIQLLIIRDFVRSWYADFSYDPQFLKETKYYLQQAFNSLVIHVAQQDPQILLTKIIQLYHSHFSLYQKACNTFNSHKVHPKTKVLTDPRFKRHSSVDDAFEITTTLHPALESETVELSYLKGVVSMVVLSACSSHLIEGPCVKTLLVQILTNKVMFPVMKMMSNPDWLMEVIIILTSDERIFGGGTAVPSVESSIRCAEENEKTASVHSNMKQLSLGQQDTDNISQSHNKYLNVSDFHKLNSLSESKDTSMTFAVEECNKNYDNNVCLASEHHFEHNTLPVLSLFDSETVDFKYSQRNMKEHSTSAIPDHEIVTHIPLVASSSIDSLSCDVHRIEDKQFDKNSTALENCNSLEEIEECFADDELDANIYFDDHFSLESEPQKIMSYRHSSSPSSSDSDQCSSMGHSTEGSSLHPESDRSSETVTSSFPKLSSIKSFFVGKQHPFVKKPKSLSLISEQLAINFNPLTHKRLEKMKSNGHHSQHPPQLLVDGVPLDNQSVKIEDSQVFSVATRTQRRSTLTCNDMETTPSPGFFSSVNSFFTTSLSQNDMSKLFENESHKSSPTPTPSPTGQVDFGLGAVAVIKDSCDLRAIDTDDRRIFQDVTIPETSINHEFRSSTQYSLYNIEYEALYFTEEGKSVIRTGNVRRRYREFLSLQSRLESHSGYKKYLKNMKAPKRWPTIPFKSIDKETVETRRLFLERYLKDLIEIEAICNGPDLREFLAYEGDSHIAFVKKSPDITVPRFDKMMMRGLSEVVDRIKALPNIPQEVMSGLRGRETPDEKPVRNQNQFDADSIDVNVAYNIDMISETSNILPMSSLQVLQDLDTEDDKDLIHSVITDPRNIEQQNEAYKQEVEKVLASLPRIQDDGAELHSEKAANMACNLSLAVLDLLAEGLQESDHWICRERVVKSMHAVLEKALNRYLENTISSLTSELQLVSYIKILRETIWPEGQLWSNTHTLRTDDQRAATREKAKQCLINFFPVSLRLAIGYQEFDEMISHFLSSLQSDKLNRHILYNILDMLLEQLFPEVTSHDFLQGLFFSRSRSTYLP
ncbi:hypothetical protein BsWGS_24102 [Bradybaena similaris]